MREAADEVIAVLCSDLHFWHKPPMARSAEEDWFAAMKRVILQLRALSHKNPVGLGGQIPVVCAGDVFDRWNPPPELINFLIKYLPKMYAVPGQHDLPYHLYEEVHRSGYWTLVEAGVVTNLPPDVPVDVPGRTPIRLHGFPWGFPPKPLEDPCDIAVEVAVVHDYLWMIGKGYYGAPDEKRVKNRKGRFKGYDVAVVGDNHTPFEVTASGCRVFNCGGFMRRKADERGHRPRVGLLRADGRVTSRDLDVTHDKFLEVGDVLKVTGGIGCEAFVEELSSLGESAIDFASAVKKVLDRGETDPDVRKLVIRLMGG